MGRPPGDKTLNTTMPLKAACFIQPLAHANGIGNQLLSAIQNKDYFLIQGCFLFIIMGVLLANFIIDIAYVLVDPRTRIGMTGETA